MTDIELQPALDEPPPRRRRRRLVVVLLSLALAGLLTVGGVSAWVSRRLNPPGGRGGEVEVTIEPGTSTAAIAELLERRGVVTDARVFRAYLRAKDAGPIQAGRYVFHRHDSVGNVMAILAGGARVEAQRLSVPEGLTLTEIADRVGRLPGRSAARFLEAARSGTVRSQLVPAGFTNLEGLLYPDTYSVPQKEDESQILSRMVRAFDDETARLGYESAPSKVKISAYQAAIVASLVEREAKVDEDRGPIARVIYNRLERGMPLQIDATIQYARGKQKERLLTSDLQIKSPYNTYLNTGLPPGPIASAGRKSLAAALDPPPGPWIYYVLADASGKHSFVTTSAEFERAKAAAHAKGLL